MIVASAVPGNEKLNEAFVIDGGAGIAADAGDVGHAVERLRDGDFLVSMAHRARQLVPRHAADAVVEAALRLVDRNSLAA
jgi:hypothetical protein